MKYYQPVFRLSAGYVEHHTPNIYKTKEEAELYLDELEDVLGMHMCDRWAKELIVDDLNERRRIQAPE